MAANMFLKIEGLKGESVVKEHEDQIDVLAWNWGGTQSGSMHVATGGGAGKVTFQDISVTKYVDKSSPGLMQKLADGSHFTKAFLYVLKAGGDKPVEYLTITMDKVMITSYSTGGSGGEDRVTENLTLNFSEVEVKYIPQDAKGKGSGDIKFGWKIAVNEPK